MTNMDVIRNFVHLYRKPFNTETIEELTGIETKTVKQYCRRNLKVHQKRNYRLHHSED